MKRKKYWTKPGSCDCVERREVKSITLEALLSKTAAFTRGMSGHVRLFASADSSDHPPANPTSSSSSNSNSNARSGRQNRDRAAPRSTTMAIPGVMAHSVSRRMSKNRGSAGSGAIAGSSGSSIINSAALQADLARQFNLNAVTRSHRRGRAPTGPAAFGGANATGGGGGGGGEAARDAWSCSSCTLVNACGTSRCEACGAPYARNDNTGEMPAEHGRLSLAQLRGEIMYNVSRIVKGLGFFADTFMRRRASPASAQEAHGGRVGRRGNGGLAPRGRHRLLQHLHGGTRNLRPGNLKLQPHLPRRLHS